VRNDLNGTGRGNTSNQRLPLEYTFSGSTAQMRDIPIAIVK